MKNKLVAVINKDLPAGAAMNALAHLAFSLGSQLDSDDAFLQMNKDASGNAWFVSAMPFIILRASTRDIKQTVCRAKENTIKHAVFVDGMTGGDYLEQIARLSETIEDEHIYYAAVLFGDMSALNSLTKKFSLYR